MKNAAGTIQFRFRILLEIGYDFSYPAEEFDTALSSSVIGYEWEIDL